MRRVLPTSERVWMRELVHCYMWWSKIFGTRVYRGAKPHFHCLFSTSCRIWHCRFAGIWEYVTATAGELLLLQYLLLLGYGSQGTATMQRVTCCLSPLADRTYHSRALPLQNTHCACSTRAPSQRSSLRPPAAPRGAGAGPPHGWAAGPRQRPGAAAPPSHPGASHPLRWHGSLGSPAASWVKESIRPKAALLFGAVFNRGVLLVEVVV